MTTRTIAPQHDWHPTPTPDMVQRNTIRDTPKKIEGAGDTPADVCQVSFFYANRLLDNGFGFASKRESRCVATHFAHARDVAQRISCTRNRMYCNGLRA